MRRNAERTSCMRSREKSQNAFSEAEEMKFNEGTADANDVFEFTALKSKEQTTRKMRSK